MASILEAEFKKAYKQVLESQNIYIASHVQPDGDNIGSMLSLGLALKKLNKNVRLLKSDEIPSDYMFLPNIDLIKDYDNIDEIDLFIALDSSDEGRLGKNKDLLSKAKTILNIDHHISNTDFGHINIVDHNASSTGELMYDFIKYMNISIDEDMATCIYTAISSDTGSFMYDNTSAKTHEIAADLIKIGIDKRNININLYQNKSLERTKLFIKTMDNLELYFENKVGLAKITQDMLEDCNAKMEDSEGIISFIRDISPVEVAILLKEFSNNEIKVSMRSKRYIDVAKICSNFGGGGHIRAAGCTINESIEEAKALILNEIEGLFR
ncbi:MAG: bifunctional oligoribonuclease/PAP phosphatase NrnA [Tissierellia bacterium]|nr:bifunctional oligoribonuclease/PAP phosphatase NrnA [Tissierellia bacterium]